MGTSAPSGGPKAKVPFDPPWLDNIALGGGDESPPDDVAEDGSSESVAESAPAMAAVGMAPAGRFRAARTNLGAFARSGDSESLRRAAGHYSRSGMGGAGNVAARMRAATRAGAGLGSFLQAARDRTDPNVNAWLDELRSTNPSAQTVIDAIVAQIIPEGGSLDEESARDSMARALSELIKLVPDVDLLALKDAQIWTLMQLYIGNEACNRMYADVGQLFENAKLSPREAVQRTNEMRRFLKNAVAARIEIVRRTSPNPTRAQLEQLLHEALRATFAVFEDSL